MLEDTFIPGIYYQELPIKMDGSLNQARLEICSSSEWGPLASPITPSNDRTIAIRKRYRGKRRYPARARKAYKRAMRVAGKEFFENLHDKLEIGILKELTPDEIISSGISIMSVGGESGSESGS